MLLRAASSPRRRCFADRQLVDTAGHLRFAEEPAESSEVAKVLGPRLTEEGQAHEASRAHDPDEFRKRGVSARPEPIERDPHVEASFGPGKSGHVSEMEVAARDSAAAMAKRASLASSPPTVAPRAEAMEMASPAPQATSTKRVFGPTSAAARPAS